MISRGSMSLFSPTCTLFSPHCNAPSPKGPFFHDKRKKRQVNHCLRKADCIDAFQRVINMCLGMNSYLTLWTGLVIGGCVSGCEPSDSATGNVRLQGEWVTASVRNRDSLSQRMSFCLTKYWPRLSHTHASNTMKSRKKTFYADLLKSIAIFA